MIFKNKKSVAGGLKAKKFGDLFESFVLHSMSKINGATIVRIPSGCRWVSGFKAISVETPFDFFACLDGKSITFDAKTVDLETFSKSRIKLHQALILHKFEKSKIISGYLVWFRPIDSVVFFKASQLMNLKKGCSLKPIDGLSVGSAKNINFEGLFNAQQSEII